MIYDMTDSPLFHPTANHPPSSPDIETHAPDSSTLHTLLAERRKL
jgi:hypothetical protein